jgi:c-di-GMP-binding flagellar brake protein YcgR
MEIDSDYLVKNPRLIVEHLTDLYKNRCIISAHFGADHASFLTIITEFDPKKNLLIVDGAPTELLNTQLLNSSEVLFHTQLDGIKVSFASNRIKKTMLEGRAAFEIGFPKAIYWLQRRQFFRVRIPMSHTESFFELSTGKSISQLVNPLEDTIVFQLADLSINGFAAFNTSEEYAKLLIEHKEFNGCKFHLNDGNQDTISFIIKEVTESKLTATNKQEQRIGCLFTNLTPQFESSIQRYMQFIERQKRKMGMF